jgi:glycosyltransferase involved in cell wall biosynthesis
MSQPGVNQPGVNQPVVNQPGVHRSGAKRPLRVLLIGRRFWPQGSIDQAGHLYQLAIALRRQGAAVEVLTPRYASSWPSCFSIREIPVHRPVLAPKRDWSIGRYTRSTTLWLRQHAAEYDVMFCDSIREESLAAIEASRSSGCPVILRSSGWGSHSDSHWWTTGRAAGRCGTIGMMADAVIAKSSICQRGLLAEGYSREKVIRIDSGFSAGPIRSSSAKHHARRALAAANSDLNTDLDSPVLVCPSNMTQHSHVTQLVGAARHLIARYPELRLWFIGDGPHRDWIYDTLRADGVRASIAMPGSFCDIEDVLTAADVYFQPDDRGLEFWMPSAIAAELPIVTINSESTRLLVGSGTPGAAQENAEENAEENPEQWVQWCAADEQGKVTAKSIRRAVRGVLDDIDSARDHATKLRRYALRTRPQGSAIEAYLTLMNKVVANSAPRRRRDSIEAAT